MTEPSAPSPSHSSKKTLPSTKPIKNSTASSTTIPQTTTKQPPQAISPTPLAPTFLAEKTDRPTTRTSTSQNTTSVYKNKSTTSTTSPNIIYKDVMTRTSARTPIPKKDENATPMIVAIFVMVMLILVAVVVGAIFKYNSSRHKEECSGNVS